MSPRAKRKTATRKAAKRKPATRKAAKRKPAKRKAAKRKPAKRKPAKPPAPAPSPPADLPAVPPSGPFAVLPDDLAAVVLFLISGVDAEKAAEAAIAKLGHTSESAAELVDRARRRIAVAADYHRPTELGTAYLRMHDLYRRSLVVQDVKTALAAARELNKLLDLYKPPPADPTAASGHNPDVAAAAAHLAGVLGPAAKGADLPEMARIAAATILSLETRAT